MKKTILHFVLMFAMLLSASAVMAQKATLVALPSTDGSVMRKVSSNGKWAVGYIIEDAIAVKATLWDLTTYESFSLAKGIIAAATDVTDDGTLVVGSYNDKPAYWTDGEWTELPIPSGFTRGRVQSVTPDGSKMVGRVLTASLASSAACYWENGELVELDLPTEDHWGEPAYDNELVAISDDGNTILGCLNYFYLPERTAFVRVNGVNKIFGQEWYDPEQGGDEYNFFDVLSMSRNGKWVTGDMYYVKEVWNNEYYCPFIYDVENDLVEIFPNDPEVASFAADDNGNLFGATPLNFPDRSARILYENNWISLDNHLLNVYGINVYEETGYAELKNVFSVSADGKTIVGVSGLVTNNWVLKLDVEDEPDSVIDDLYQPNNGHTVVVRDGQLMVGGKVSGVEIFNLMGQKVFGKVTNGSAPIFNVSYLPSGIYIVRVTDINNNMQSTKVWIGNN